MSWSPEGDLKFGVFSKKRHQLKYVDKGSNHTPGTLHAILSGVLNRLARITPHKPYFNSERVDNVYPEHAISKAGLAPIVYRQWDNDGKVNIKKRIPIMKKNP